MRVAVLLVLSSCVGPARTFDAYEADAVATAEEAVSAGETALLAVRSGADGEATAPYLSVVLKETEETASSVQGQFDSIQPPNEDADGLHRELDALLDDTNAVLERLRIHVRRGEIEALPGIAAPLTETLRSLDKFATEHDR